MDWEIFNAALWGSLVVWLVPRGAACIWSAVRAVAS